METIVEWYPALLTAIGALVIVTNVIVEVLKKLIPNTRFPTNFLAVLVSMTLTLVTFFGWADYTQFPTHWYYVAAAVVVGLFVSYAAMFGFDKLKEALRQIGQGQ